MPWRKHEDVFARAELWLVEHMASCGESPVDACAAALDVPRRTLQREFARNGTTVREALWIARMEWARSMLERGATSQRAAAAVGYRQPAQFAKAFRRRFGISPSDARAIGTGERS